mgnify:CR=1 FL=1
MKKVEHGKTFDRNAANPPAFEIFHNTVTEGYPKHWHTAIEIIMPTRGEYEVVVGKDSYNLKEGDIIMINSGVVHGMRFVSQGERIVMLVEPGCVENQEEMETIFLRLPAIYFKKEDEEDPFYLFLRSQILELVREYDNEGAVMTHRICTGLKELFFRVWPQGLFGCQRAEYVRGNEAAGIYRGCFKRLPLYQCPLHGESFSRGSSCGQRIFQVPLYQNFQAVHEHDIL